MNIQKRLEKIEQKVSNGQSKVAKTEVCDHPPSAISIYRDYPVKGWSDQSIVTKLHCTGCGFQDYLWSHFALTEEQELHRHELMFAASYEASRAYDLELLNAGLVKYVLYPDDPNDQAILLEEIKRWLNYEYQKQA